MAFVPEYILILFSTILIDYVAGHLIGRSQGSTRKAWLVLSIVSNVGILVFYKYFNFLNNNLSHFFHLIHAENPVPALQILLPIGLSFHTFQAMSYTIEVYHGRQAPEKHLGLYALYVMFYPQLVAGPIERPQNLLPQFRQKHEYDAERIRRGILRMAWGFFKKVVIADRLAMVVDECYGNVQGHNGLSMALAVLFYSFQIYCDFSGYTDIALGAARVMGFDLMENFRLPYLSASLSEFWSRWHISLSGWFKDYLYFPLGGSRQGIGKHIRNLLLVFAISGLWHGARWTFVAWGLMHAAFLIASTLRDRFLPKVRLARVPGIAFTFILVTLLWIFFRAAGLSEAMTVLHKLSAFSIRQHFDFKMGATELVFSFALIAILFLKEVYGKFQVSGRFAFYGALCLLVLSCYLFGIYNQKQFIYFQF
jgi:alginate O-acetyltransferase complex protein AlgI